MCVCVFRISRSSDCTSRAPWESPLPSMAESGQWYRGTWFLPVRVGLVFGRQRKARQSSVHFQMVAPVISPTLGKLRKKSSVAKESMNFGGQEPLFIHHHPNSLHFIPSPPPHWDIAHQSAVWTQIAQVCRSATWNQQSSVTSWDAELATWDPPGSRGTSR